ncbi:MAG: tRNA (guanosine(46)-N7)-methyltransferase TrmB [Candidatus Komeilibacteria bacterium]|jgi:tRNA (guanine-N7-)-methyltransferase|nr:tRNA (guanosine(46)-N7)-methyltransferase TrmB [Candidatus Komeilibacteria bacterium]MBT4447503.1 tRNA (guanosine(46)-N7)-methyltransferase TrmB [Candidatus Komeilibacteria bacterium]
MSRQKLQRFAELATFKNVAQFNQADAKNKLKDFLDGNQEIILELACGKGDYSLALAKKYPNKKIIGVDIQGERIWYGAGQALDKKLDNLFFLRMQIESLEEFFTKHSISEIWITFPDPFPRERQIKKRLSSPRFLNIYKNILIANGLIHLKTDDLNLFDYSIITIKNNKGEIIEEIRNIYKQKKLKEILKTKTDFEKKHLKAGRSIHYLKFKL